MQKKPELSKRLPWPVACTLIPILRGRKDQNSVVFFMQDLLGAKRLPEVVQDGQSSTSKVKK